jgi:hypothetical protein
MALIYSRYACKTRVPLSGLGQAEFVYVRAPSIERQAGVRVGGYHRSAFGTEIIWLDWIWLRDNELCLL